MDFVDVIGYEGLYKINQAGEVLGVKRQKILKPGNSGTSGYYYVTLCKDSKHHKNYFIHRLLALHFLPNPLNLPQVDHIDRNKENNSLDNLRWVTRRDNCLNKGLVTTSGEHNIKITPCNTFCVEIRINKKYHSKTFKTLEEAIVARDDRLQVEALFKVSDALVNGRKIPQNIS
jgi:hypothetical protein